MRYLANIQLLLFFIVILPDLYLSIKVNATAAGPMDGCRTVGDELTVVTKK